MDVVKEGDGERIVRCIKMFLLHFKEDGSGSTRYALEALFHMFQLYALLSPREAERMKWNRTVNNHGQPGCNVAMLPRVFGTPGPRGESSEDLR